jgi:hypothetical protein
VTALAAMLLVPCWSAPAQGPPAPGTPALAGLELRGGEPVVVCVGDVDGDGVSDLLVQYGYVWQPPRLDLLRGRGDGSFLSGETVLDLASFGAFRFTRLVDADADGILDLLVFVDGIDASRVLLGVGDGSFGAPIVMPGRNVLRDEDQFATADFDLDGRQDLVVTGQTSSGPGGTMSTTVSVYVGGPGGLYSGPQGFSIGFFSGLGALTTGDFDGDGLPDVLCSVWPALSSAPPAGLWMHSGTGTGGLVATPVVTPLDTLPSSLVAWDFDGDGDLDVAALDGMHGTLQPAVRVMLGNGAGTFAMAGWLPVAAPPGQGNVLGARLLAADVDADGLTDLLAVPETSSTLSLFRGTGGGQFLPATTHALGAKLPGWLWRRAESADLDGDGRDDVVVSHVLEGTVRTLLAGTAPFVPLGLGQPLPSSAPVLAASGSTVPGMAVALDLSAVPPATHGLLLVDLATGLQPAFGLTVAVPDGAALPVSGNQTLGATWPAGLAPGTVVYVQALLLGPAGFSTSNALALIAGT